MSEVLFVALGVVGALLVFAVSVVAVLRERSAMLRNGDEQETEPRPAGLMLRLAALMIDSIVANSVFFAAIMLVAVLEASGLVSGWGWWALVLVSAIVAYLVYFTVLTATRGRTWGKRVAGIVVQKASGETVGWGRAAARTLATAVFLALQQILVGYLDPLVLAFNKRKRSIHDLVAGTAVNRVGPAPGAALPVLAVCAWILPFVLVFAVVRPFFVQLFYVTSSGMIPTVGSKDHVLVNKLSYRIGEVKTGDVVVCEVPSRVLPNIIPGRRVIWIERVVALPGDTVQVRDADGVYLNGRRIDAPYWVEKPRHTGFGGNETYGISKPYRVPSGCCFVLGDNLNYSMDSRFWGPLPLKKILGKATVRFWPPKRIGDL